MPTVSCVNHIAGHSGGHKFVGSGDSSVVDNGIKYVDEAGKLNPAAEEVIAFIANKHPEVVLCTGHGYAHEVDAVVRKAAELGVKKICVNHPHFLVNATYEQMREWADLGAYIELNAAVFSSIAKSGTCSDEMAGKILEIIPTEKIVLDSDLGQRINVDPITGMPAIHQPAGRQVRCHRGADQPHGQENPRHAAWSGLIPFPCFLFYFQ